MLRVKDLVKRYPLRGGFLKEYVGSVTAVDRVSFSIGRGRTLGLVGESGSGKTTVAKLVVGLERPDSGRIDLATKKVSMIFQDPATSLDPKMRVGDIILEPIRVKRERRDLKSALAELLRKVHLPQDAARGYPHEFSGGERQRIAIARAIAANPELIVCDEPVSSLDVTVQEQILMLLKGLQRDMRLTYLFISHDLRAVEYLSNEIAVMYKGAIVEAGDARKICRSPQHPYTRELLSSVLTVSSS